MARGTCALQKSRILTGGGVLPSYGRVAGVKGVDKPYYTGPLVWDLPCTPASSSLRPYKVKYFWYLIKKELVLSWPLNSCVRTEVSGPDLLLPNHSGLSAD